MSEVKIVKVSDKSQLEAFIQFHYDLYRGNEYDVPNLHSDEVTTLSQDKNPAFEFCKAQYFLAYKDGKVVGRVAAIINEKANKRWGQSRVRFGWIDFIDDIEVSRALLAAVENWGREQGMKEVVGPLGFTDMDPEGMLTWGFDQLGTQATIYNYPYYPEHMEKLGGWEKDNDYVEYKMYVPDEVPEKYDYDNLGPDTIKYTLLDDANAILAAYKSGELQFIEEVRPNLEQFGTNCLRMGRRLQEGFVVTDEPGIYFIPALIDDWKASGHCAEFLNFDKIETYKDFGGIRIEDDVLITKDGCRFIGKDRIPYHPKDVEEYMAAHREEIL